MTPETVEQGTEMEATLPVPHRAICRECEASVLFHATGSGNGMVVMSSEGMEVGTVIGIGDGGLPLCPRGHGEMSMEDQAIPAGDAITQAAEQLRCGGLEPLQTTLPGLVPPFNYQGAYLELEEKAVEVDNLKHEWESDKEAAAASKKAWERAAELYTKMALEFQRRRRENVEIGQPVTDLDGSRCTFEQLNPDVTCPLCVDSVPEAEEFARLGGIAPKNSAEHAQQAEELLLTKAVEDLVFLLEGAANMIVSEETVRAWSAEEREEVRLYANAVMGGEDPLPARPKVLGTMHVAGELSADGQQACTQCDAVLQENAVDAEIQSYPCGSLVGTDCAGKPVEEQRYIKRNKKAAKGRK